MIKMLCGGSFFADITKPVDEIFVNCNGVGNLENIRYLPPVTLSFTIVDGYPSSSDFPFFTLSCKWLSSSLLDILAKGLIEIWSAHEDEGILWYWFEFLEKDAWNVLGFGEQLDLFTISESLTKSTTQIGEMKSNYCVVQECFSLDTMRKVIKNYDRDQRRHVFNKASFNCCVCSVSKIGSQCYMFEVCKHIFCLDCIRADFHALIAEGRFDQLACLQCDDYKATPAVIKQIVDFEHYERYERLVLERSLDIMDDVVQCPRCKGRVVIESKDKGQLGLCPQCYFSFCLLCNAVYHGLNPCQLKNSDIAKLLDQYNKSDGAGRYQLELKYGRERIMKALNEHLSHEYLENATKCPSCKSRIEKIDGCNKMTCGLCRCYFCWLCHQVLDKYNPYTHYGKVGSPCYNRLFHKENGEGPDDDNFDVNIDWIDEED